MIETILIALYILGCVLAYGRFNAQYVEDKELYGMYSHWTLSDFILISLSWVTFFFRNNFLLRGRRQILH